MNIGSKGGRVKASTSFSFMRIQRNSEKIAASLAQHGIPFKIPIPARRYKLFDTMLLHILHHHPRTAAKVFSCLFKHNPIDRIFRFLDKNGSLTENLALMLSAPSLPCIKAWLRTHFPGRG